MNFSITRLTILLATLLAAASLPAQTPEWIWHDNHGKDPQEDEVCFLRKTFTLAEKPTAAELMASCDNEMEVFLNGESVASGKEWQQAAKVNVARWLKSGENVLAVRAQNHGGPAAFVARLQVTLPDKKKMSIVTDSSWFSSLTKADGWLTAGFAATDWAKPATLAKLGDQPWGNVFATAVASNGKAATPAESLFRPAGFQVELLRTALPGEGSWVAMTVDPKGRLIISPQGGEPMQRVTLDAQGQIAKMEPIDLPVRGAMGLLYANESLYVNGRGKEGYHLYRLRDTDGDDQYDNVELIRRWEGGDGEHGSHGIVLGADKKLYIVCGNFVNVPVDILPTSPHRNYADDLVLPRAEDGNGFGAGRKPPGGFVVRMDADGKNAELFASGQRNTYDIAFNPDGELFGFDSDMEWDWGTPWYRPTRVFHLVSGGDQGFREGTAKWPEYYQDSLPATVNVGVGSPTGVKFGTGAKFPPAYQKALYVMDWSYGRILAVHFESAGASYTATFEPFITGKPLNVTDLEIGRDGAMYFITGGRGTQSGLYRVTHVNPSQPETSKTAKQLLAAKDAVAARILRHQLEAFQGHRDPKAIDFVWLHLNSEDRWIRYAARVALESQDVKLWRERALKESKPRAALTALLALARSGVKEDAAGLVNQLLKFSFTSLAAPQRVELLRTYEVAFARLGKPNPFQTMAVIEQLDPNYPAMDDAANRELCQLLIYLEVPTVITKSLVMLQHEPKIQVQLDYLFSLRNLKTGWTLDQRRYYFTRLNTIMQTDESEGGLVKWFADVGRSFSLGASFPNQIAQLRREVVAALSAEEQQQLAAVIAQPAPPPKPAAAPRSFVQDWKTGDLVPLLGQAGKGRSFAKGKEAFNAAQCLACHRFGNEGGAVGPDITAVSSRFSRRDLLESILEPSKVISDQYQSTTIVTKNDEDFTGRLVDEDATKVALMINPLAPQRVEILKADITRREASKLSPMPEGLINTLTKEEILDLLAYIESSGRKNHPAFAK